MQGWSDLRFGGKGLPRDGDGGEVSLGAPRTSFKNASLYLGRVWSVASREKRLMLSKNYTKSE